MILYLYTYMITYRYSYRYKTFNSDNQKLANNLVDQLHDAINAQKSNGSHKYTLQSFRLASFIFYIPFSPLVATSVPERKITQQFQQPRTRAINNLRGLSLGERNREGTIGTQERGTDRPSGEEGKGGRGQVEQSRTNVKEEIRWNGQEERVVQGPEKKKRDDEDVGRLPRRCEKDGGTIRARGVWSSSVFVAAPPLPLILQTANNTPRFVRGTQRHPLSIDLDALLLRGKAVIETSDHSSATFETAVALPISRQ